MFNLLLVYYLICLKGVLCFRFKRSLGLQQHHRVSNLNSIIDSASKSDPNHYRVGTGFDIHKLIKSNSEGRPLKLGGVSIPGSSVNVLAHSDGDVVLHSISDAILGALGKGDIGELFPDSDPKFDNYDSSKILKRVLELSREMNYVLVNVDVCIILETPKLGHVKSKIRENLSSLLGFGTAVNVKAKTNEKLDSIGSGSAIACNSVALLQHRN